MSDDGYGLVMPFVVCASQGGPYADIPFVSGYRIGYLDARLQHERPALVEEYVAPGDVPQVDLLAMRRGYTATFEPYDDDWTLLRLRAGTFPPAAKAKP